MRCAHANLYLLPLRRDYVREINRSDFHLSLATTYFGNCIWVSVDFVLSRLLFRCTLTDDGLA